MSKVIKERNIHVYRIGEDLYVKKVKVTKKYKGKYKEKRYLEPDKVKRVSKEYAVNSRETFAYTLPHSGLLVLQDGRRLILQKGAKLKIVYNGNVFLDDKICAREF